MFTFRKLGKVAALLIAITVLFIVPVSAQDNTSETEEVPPFTVEINFPDSEAPNAAEFWVEWPDSQRLKTPEPHFWYSEHYIHNDILVVVGVHHVMAYDLSQPGHILPIELVFESPESDSSEFFVFDKDQSLIGRFLFNKGTPGDPSYKIEMLIWQVTEVGTNGMTAEDLPCGLDPYCDEDAVAAEETA